MIDFYGPWKISQALKMNFIGHEIPHITDWQISWPMTRKKFFLSWNPHGNILRVIHRGVQSTGLDNLRASEPCKADVRGTQVSLKNTPVSLNSTHVSLNSSPVSLRVSIYVGGCSCLVHLPRMPRTSALHGSLARILSTLAINTPHENHMNHSQESTTSTNYVVKLVLFRRKTWKYQWTLTEEELGWKQRFSCYQKHWRNRRKQRMVWHLLADTSNL